MAAVSAIPPPNPVSAEAHNHPSYKEMIVAAIGSLKEKNGSSESAIATYIVSNYKNLPRAHDALLSSHLRHLKKQGIIETVHSYKLATVGENTSNSASKKRGRPKKNPSWEGIASPSSEKRKRGRPHKVVSGPTIILPQHMKAVIKVDKRGSLESGEKRKRGRPKRLSIDLGEKSSQGQSKKKRGRPVKSLALLTVSPEGRKRGRPVKWGSTPAKLDGTTLSSKKRRPGRPKRGSTTARLGTPSLLGATETSIVTSGTPASGEKRKRGRPMYVSSSGGKPRGPMYVSSSGGKPRGRPPKIKNIATDGKKNADQNEPSSATKRRGRPAKTKSIASIETSDVGGKVDHNTTVGNGEGPNIAAGNGEIGTDQNTNLDAAGEGSTVL